MSGWKCPECGLEYDSILPPDGVAAMRSYPRRYKEQFPPRDDDEKPDAVIRRRPEPTVWSALEYAAHVADAVDALADAVRVMTIQDHPTIGFFDPDQRAEQERYNERDRQRVLDDLTASCEKAAAIFAAVDNNAWSREATFPWGDRDALTMMRNCVHEGYHHLRDIEKVLRAVVGR